MPVSTFHPQGCLCPECQRPGPSSASALNTVSDMRLQTNAPKPGIPIDREALKASGFKNANILIVNLDDPRLGWVDVAELTRIGRKLYDQKAG
jgi:hypothetical protein